MTNRRKFLMAGGVALAATGATHALAHRRHQDHKPSGNFIKVDGISLHYKTLGNTGPKLIVIHGASGNLLDWTLGPALELAKTNQVLLFDRPGLGFSQRAPKNGSDISVQAGLMRRAAAELGWGEAVLLGHSFGGSVALAWALDGPETVLGLLLLSAPSHVWPTGPSLRNRIASTPITGPILANIAAAFVTDSMINASIAEVFAPQAPPDNYASKMLADLALRPDIFQANASDIVGLKPQIEAMVPQYDRLKMPMEILHGTADTIVWPDLHSKPLADRLPHANLQLLDGIGHMPHHSATEAMLTALKRLNQTIGA